MPNQLIQKKDRPPIDRVTKDAKDIATIAIKESSLKAGFEKFSFEKGLKYLNKLEVEYKGLNSLLLNSRIEDTVLNLKRVSKLTDSLYRQGLSFLSQILHVAEQTSTSSKEELLEESKELREELERSRPNSVLHRMIGERLEKNSQALSTVKAYSEKLDEYFCQVGLCKDSIREIRLGIPELLDNKPKEEYDKVLLELRTRVEMAQRVQAEYTRQGI